MVVFTCPPTYVFLLITQNLRGPKWERVGVGDKGLVGRVWLKPLAGVIFFVDQSLKDSNFRSLVRFGWITPYWKAFMLLFSNIYYAFDHLSCDIFAASSFSPISGKIRNVASFNPIQPHSLFLVYLLATNVLSVCRSLKKLKNQG